MTAPRAFPLWLIVAMLIIGGYLWTYVEELIKTRKRKRAMLTNRELLDLIGEIDGIDLRSTDGGIAVYLQIGDREFELIKDSGDTISHHITRIGIASIISWGGKSINNLSAQLEPSK